MARDVATVAALWNAAENIEGNMSRVSTSTRQNLCPQFIDYPAHDDVLLSIDFPNGEAWHYFWAGSQPFRTVIEAARHQLVAYGSLDT